MSDDSVWSVGPLGEIDDFVLDEGVLVFSEPRRGGSGNIYQLKRETGASRDWYVEMFHAAPGFEDNPWRGDSFTADDIHRNVFDRWTPILPLVVQCPECDSSFEPKDDYICADCRANRVS